MWVLDQNGTGDYTTSLVRACSVTGAKCSDPTLRKKKAIAGAPEQIVGPRLAQRATNLGTMRPNCRQLFFCLEFCCASITPSTLPRLIRVEPVSTNVGRSALGSSALVAASEAVRRL